MLLFLMACGLFKPDLPDGWEDAWPVDDLSQTGCGDTGLSEPDTGLTEAMTAWPAEPGIRVAGDPVMFRCDQDVEGFYRTDGDTVDVLFQPKKMNPTSVTKCDCAYRIEAGVPEVAPATVSLWARWDNVNDPNEPREIGSAEVEE